MKNIFFRDFFRRMNYLKNEAKIRFLKAIIFDSYSKLLDKTKASFILSSKCAKFSWVKIINYCIVTGRSKSVLWEFRLSWMEFKNLASKGLLPGIKKWGF